MELPYGLIIVLFHGVVFVSAAMIDCPADWVTNILEQNCYKFVSHPKLTYEEAASYCIDKGAYLISINTAEEHSFINNWLQANDGVTRNKWYTSGYLPSGSIKFIWEGDNSYYGLSAGNTQHWVTNIEKKRGNRIMYEFDGFNYGWDLTYGNRTIGFICEINQRDADRIISERRDYTYGSTVYDKLNVEFGPAFTILPEDIVMIPAAVLVFLDCSAVGNPKPIYKWIKVEGGQETEISSEADPRYTLTNGKLTIQTPKPSDVGQYRCEAMNKFGKIRTKTIQMSFGSLGEFANVQDAPYNTLAYDGAAVECSRISYNPAVTYSWKRTLENSFVQSIYTEVTPHIFASLNGKLYFSEIQKVDAGEYYCQVDLFGLSNNAVGAAQPPSRTSYPIEVNVQDQAAKPNWGPSIQNDFIAVFPKPPLRGRDVQMECFAYGSARNYESSWSYSWRREGAPMPETAKMSDFNRILVIQNAQKHDEGTYTCFVSRNNQQTDSRSVTIVLSAKPYFVIPLKNQHLDSGSTINWRCQASGTPAPRYTWFKNGEMLTPQPDLQINKNILTISNADAKRHSGMYQCRASSDLGEAYSTAEVRVLSFKPTFRKNPLPNGLDAALRGNVTIVCDPEAAPAPEKEWFRNNIKLNLPVGTMITGPRVRKLPSGNIYITNIQQSDAGIYTCQASNINGKASSSCRLNVRDSAVITVKPKLTQTVFVNETAFIACEASYNQALDLLYIWKFNGQTIDIDKDFHYARSPHASGMMVKMAQFWNAGTYECIARTTLSEVSAKGELKIEGPPGEPLGVYGEAASVTSTSIHLFWFPGADHGKAITHYRIEAESDFEKDKWITVAENIPEIQTKLSGTNRDKRHFFVTSLDPGNGYRFRVQAINQLGYGIYSQPSRYYQTLQAPPSEAPIGLGGGGGSVGDLTITWKKLHRRYHGGVGLTYTVYWRLYNGDTSGKWEFKQGIDWETEKFVTLVGENNFYLEYEVKIQAWNRLGPGTNSSSVLVFSAEGMPIAAPLDVSSSGFNSTALEVSWTEVEDTREKMRGKIGGYQVNYWLRYEEEPVYKRFIRFKGQRSSGVVIGLASDTYYYTQVQVFNSAGLGPLGQKYPGETFSFAPFLYPQEVRVVSHGFDSVKLFWRGISTTTDEDTLKGYKIYLWKANENFRMAEELITEKNPTEQVISKLEKDYVYAVRIAGYSGGGDGAKSPTIYFALGQSSVRIDTTVTSIIASAPVHLHTSLCIVLSLLCVSLVL